MQTVYYCNIRSIMAKGEEIPRGNQTTIQLQQQQYQIQQ
jgi:hypothetical protein